MEKQRIISVLVFLLVINTSWAQLPYFDIPGLAIRKAEEKSVRDFQKQNLTTTGAYATTAALSGTERLTRTKFRVNPINLAFIDYSKYSNMCRSYLNPFEKAKCTNKYNYLKNAHQTVLFFVNTPTQNEVNNGVKEQILAKYTAITNTILKELEMLKLKAEKDNFYTRLIIK